MEAAAEREEELSKKREMALVIVKEEDVNLLAAEWDIGVDEANTVLRQHKGDIMEAVKFLLAK